jgi:lipoyl(octanoyl) transferase
VKIVRYLNLGRMDYHLSFDMQTRVNYYLQNHQEIAGFLMMVEHQQVFTLGRNSNLDNFLLPLDYIKRQGFDVIKSNRGGDVTYHGPGQIVGYPLLNLEHFQKNVNWYIWALEEWIIRTLAHYGLPAARKPAYRGVWVNNEKICALGITIKHWGTMHGIALNHTTNLDHFKFINPCGISEFGVTSLEKLGCCITVEHIINTLILEFEEVFQCSLVSIPLLEVNKIVNNPNNESPKKTRMA